MTRRSIMAIGFCAVAVALIIPAACSAFFPPDVFPSTKSIPPDPFTPPDGGGLGEPEPTDPGTGPTVQTPEPATVVTALTGLALAAAYRWRQRRAA